MPQFLVQEGLKFRNGGLQKKSVNLPCILGPPS